MTARPSFPLREAVLCPDCETVFCSRDVACPTCASVLGIVPLQTDAPAREIARLRDREAWITAALLQIAHGLQDQHFKTRVAKKALDYLKTGTAPESPSAAPQTRKESYQ